MQSFLKLLAFAAFLTFIGEVASHGRLMDPPARNCMWRFGYPNPVNYDDNQNWCGGAAVMQIQNGGRCGICGDSWSDPEPRPHEAGGQFANGIIVRRYAPGQIVDIEVDLTANHMGTFEWKLCPVMDSEIEVTNECLDRHLVPVVDGNGDTTNKYTITTNEKSKTFYLKLKLPLTLSCSHCVLQWTYVAANTWGTCPNGTEAVGCGPQETFINCADIAIIPNSGSGFGPPPHPNLIYYKDYTKKGEPLVPLIVKSQVCLGKGAFIKTPGIDSWCQKNCMQYPPNCPKDKCHCIQDCDAIGSFKRTIGSGAYCLDKCMVNPPANCTADRCICY